VEDTSSTVGLRASGGGASILYPKPVWQSAPGVPQDGAGGELIAFGDGGPGTSAEVGAPGGLAVNVAGTIYYSENSFNSQRARDLSLNPPYTPPVPWIAAGTVTNGASFAPPPVAPGSIVTAFDSIYGNFTYGNFTLASAAMAVGTPLPTTLAGLSIQFQVGSWINAPLYYASPGQVNFQIPWELTGQTSVPMRAVLNGVASHVETLSLASFAPGIFLVSDSSTQPITYTNPATAGSTVSITCRGLGAVTNAPPSGSPGSNVTPSTTRTAPTVTIGGMQASVLSSGLTPGTVGEYTVTVQVPAGVTPGYSVPVVLSIGGVTSNTVGVVVK
jgi:uncharacterized protein (TIGR03437 family)